MSNSDFLELGKGATNMAVLGELGRYPLLLEMFLNVLRYYKYVLKSDDILLSEALTVSKSMCDINRGYCMSGHSIRNLLNEFSESDKNEPWRFFITFRKRV